MIKRKSNALELSTVSKGHLGGLTIPEPMVQGNPWLWQSSSPPSPSKDHMLVIPITWSWQCIWNTGNHLYLVQHLPGQDASTWVLQDGVLLIKFLSIDGLATRAIMAWEVTILAHESWNNYVKARTLLTKSFLSSGQSTKVFHFPWKFVYKQFKGGSSPRAHHPWWYWRIRWVDHGWCEAASGSSGICKVSPWF